MAGPQIDCIFCRIVRKEASAHLVYEDERTIGFMDIAPVAEGHTLIIPKAHCDDLFDAEAEDLRAVIVRAHQVAHAIGDVLRPDGLGVFQLNGTAAGQTVFHYHMHLVPRNHGDELRLHGRTPGDPEVLADVARRLREALVGS